MDHWKTKLNSLVFKRVLNDSSESASRVLELRLFQTVGAQKQKLRLAAMTSGEESEEDVVPQTSGSVTTFSSPGDCGDRKVRLF